MQRRELTKRIHEYASTVNFHKLGLIRQLIKLKEKRRIYLEEDLKHKEVLCPDCKKEIMEIEYEDCEYGGSTYLNCSYCGFSLDDSDDAAVNYIDAYNRFMYEDYFDSLLCEVYFGEIKGSGYSWELYCEETIKDMLARGLND